MGIESGFEWSLDVVLHEYGHWVMHCLYNGDVPSEDYGTDGVHYWDSHETPVTAWVEGWATFYSCAIRGDRYMRIHEATFDLEAQEPRGDDVEGAIAGILWDIHDSANDANDVISLGLSPIWEVVSAYVPGHHITTVHEFWNGWFTLGHSYSAEMSAIFSNHGVPKDSNLPAAISEVTYPYYVTLGKSVNIRISGENLAGQADEGYLQVSFPDAASSVEVVGSSASNSKIYWPGAQLWAGYGQYKITAAYPHVEAWEAPWPSGGNRYLEIKVTPPVVGAFIFYVKMTVGVGGVWYADPKADGSESSLNDEQNEYVWSYEINVTTEPPTQHYLTVVSPYGTTGGQDWFDSGTTAYASVDTGLITDGNDTRHIFTNWSGDASGTNYAQSNPINMSSEKTAIANWKTQYKVTFAYSGLDSSATGTVVVVTGNSKTYGNLPYSVWVDDANSIAYSFENVTSSIPGKRFILTDTTGPSSPAEIAGPTIITSNYKTQYLVTFDQVGVGSDFSGEILMIDGEQHTSIMLPSANWLDSGSQHSFAFASLLIVDESRSYAWSSTAGLSMLRESSLTINESGNIIGSYNYQVRIVTDGGSYNVTTTTNSTISDFIFDRANKEITFKITGTEGTAGFCRISIPSTLLWGDFSVYRDGSLLLNGTDYTQSNNGTHYTFDFCYSHSIHTIEIKATEAIPEFTPLVVLLFYVLTLLLILRKRLPSRALRQFSPSLS